MRFHHFKSLIRIGTCSPDERVFAEASELAHRGLEQCVADLQSRLATLNETEGPIAQETIAIAFQAKTVNP